MFRKTNNRNQNRCRKNNARRPGKRPSLNYETLETRQLLAVSAVFDAGVLTVGLTDSGDEAIVSVDGVNVTVNGSLIDTDNVQGGIQAATVNDFTNLTFVGTAGLTDLSVQLNGAFETDNLISIGLNNINQSVINGSYVTDFFNGVLVGDVGSLSGPGSIVVNGSVNLSSVDTVDIVLDNPNNDFRGLTNITTGGNLTLQDATFIFLGTIDVGGNFSITTPNAFVTDSLVSSIEVDGFTMFDSLVVDLGSNGQAVDLFVVIADVAGSLALNEQNMLIFGSNSTVGSAVIQAGFVTMGPNANVNIIGDGVFDAFALRLGVGGSNTFNTGGLNFNAVSNVFIWENSSVLLFGNNSAANVDIIASGDISDAANASLNVDEIASFQSTAGISIGNAANDVFNAGSIRFFANAVSISEDSNMQVGGLANFANTLTLTADGTITDSDDAYILVVNNATFISRKTDQDSMGIAGVIIGDTVNDFFTAGSISFDVEDGNFVLTEDNATVIASPNGFTNSATAIRITSTDNLSNTDGALIDVETNASFIGSSLSLGQAVGDDLQFGSTTLGTTGNAQLSQDNAILFTSNSFVVGNLFVSTAGAIADSSFSRLNIMGAATFIGSAITLGDSPDPTEPNGMGDIFNAGTLTIVSPGNVDITENSSIVLAGSTMQTANVLSLTSTGDMNGVGTISNLPGAMLSVASNLFVTAIGNITLGADASDSINFDNLNFNTAGNVDITAIFADEESGFFIFGTSNNPNVAAELRLTTNVDVRDGTNAVIVVDNFIRIDARNIILGDTDTDCIMIPENGEFVTTQNPAEVTVNETCEL